MAAESITRYRFEIRTRTGSRVDALIIPGSDQAEAERKLKQMYIGCDVIACRPEETPLRRPGLHSKGRLRVA